MSSEASQRGPGDPGIIIETPRLLLCPYVLSDAEAVLRIRSNPENLKHLPIFKPTKNVEEARTWIAERLAMEHGFNFACVLRSAPETIIGGVGAIGGHRAGEWGYIIDSPWVRQGYATEAVRACIDAYWTIYPNGHPGVSEEKRDKAECWINQGNDGSTGVVRRLGFRKEWEGVEEDRSGNRMDLEIWRVGREEWQRGMEGREKVKFTQIPLV